MEEVANELDNWVCVGALNHGIKLNVFALLKRQSFWPIYHRSAAQYLIQLVTWFVGQCRCLAPKFKIWKIYKQLLYSMWVPTIREMCEKSNI